MVKEISIVTGDPSSKKGGASFTCFVLPFRYRPRAMYEYEVNENLHRTNGARYTPINMDSQAWIKRQRYFTSETAKVLYEHAKWFELSESYWKMFEDRKIFDFKNAQQRKIKVRLHPPRLALFEWHDAIVDEQQKEADLFQTGFLIIEASFITDQNYPVNYADLLNFNELFRYWRVPFDGHQARMEAAMGDAFGHQTEALYFSRWADLLQIPIQPTSGKKRCALFPKTWATNAQSWWSSEAKNQPLTAYQGVQHKNAGWIGHADERTFVWSCVVVEQGTNALALMGGEGNEATVVELGAWIKLLNVDQPRDIASINKASAFEKKWVNDRWPHFGVLYGFNYHAGVMLTGPCDEPPITRHFHDQYLDMTLLLLYLRVTLFRFSNELTRLSAEMRSNSSMFNNHRQEFRTLRREFAIFTNLYQFPLISNQQQAIEMYELIRKHMDVKDLFREIEEEIKGYISVNCWRIVTV